MGAFEDALEGQIVSMGFQVLTLLPSILDPYLWGQGQPSWSVERLKCLLLPLRHGLRHGFGLIQL